MCRTIVPVLAIALGVLSLPVQSGAETIACTSLALDIRRTESRPTQYQVFCEATPRACLMQGPASIGLDPDRLQQVATVNRAVNNEIILRPDMECYGLEEIWTLHKAGGYGDCEDMALEKRQRLVEAGFPSAALTLAIVHHREQYFAHAVLLLESDHGTLVLDNLSDDIACWDDAPYEFERREHPDGTWIRFVRPNVRH
ncbi:transglutaminase-like cysteine peptidase [Pseudoruegeria sp. HB172150]|uniref:transglutaminase-like cysteine peptidase n=1 Tax=Pseudoruegeria sp. HB172150 TaxID=2721164 RepID=UPI001556A8E0|nr:transglutaminase-like cysteine peptidase [Pseudoruegeria sp. HB172150]